MAGKGWKRGRKPAGTGVRRGGKNGPQVVRTGEAREVDREVEPGKTSGRYWTDEAEAGFLDALAASCNVAMAAAAIGYTPAALYWRRRQDPGFAQAWQLALEQGYVRIEGLMLERAEDALAGRMPDPSAPIPAMTVAQAMELLRMHRASVHGNPRTPGRRARVRSLDEVRGSIMAKLGAIEEAELGGAELGGAGCDG